MAIIAICVSTYLFRLPTLEIQDTQNK